MMNPDDEILDARAVEKAADPELPLPEAPLRVILEALLFASAEPVTVEEIAGILGEGRAEEIAAALDALVEEYASPGRGLRVQRLAGGFRITSDPELGPYLREMVRARNRHRLSRAALETLSIVAYKQPITSPEIEQIRGVNPSAILNALLDRRLIRILGRKKVVGKPFLYGTTREFLIRFGLNSLDDLPSMDELSTMLETEIPVTEPTGSIEVAGTEDQGAESVSPKGPEAESAETGD